MEAFGGLKKADDTSAASKAPPPDDSWLEDKLERRRLAALERVRARSRPLKAKRRRRARAVREVSLVMLSLAVMLLGVLLIEIGLRAFSLYQQLFSVAG